MLVAMDKSISILTQNLYTTVATTTTDGTPWSAAVFITHDEQLNFYWASDMTSQHSQNIGVNPKVFLAMYDSQAPWGKGSGLFIEAVASEVNEPGEIEKACTLRKIRVPNADQTLADFSGTSSRRIYKAMPGRVWMNTSELKDGVFMRDYRVEIPLDELRQAA